MIYSALSNWTVMAEEDFTDFYLQIKFRMSSEREKDKLGFLCIRTAQGTLCFSRATMGLLGMDTYQDELTDRLLGDLVLQGHVVKLADNIYFGAESMKKFVSIFKVILGRCSAANLKLKPRKVKLNIKPPIYSASTGMMVKLVPANIRLIHFLQYHLHLLSKV